MRRAHIIAAYIAFVALFAGYWVLLAAAPDFHARVLQGEDRLVEWVTFAGFAGACLATLTILRRRRKMDRRSLAYLAFLALFFFVCAGEELSWGQRLFGFQTPERVADLNTQNEFNIHNLEIEHFHPKDIVSWFMKLFGIILPLVLIRRMRSGDSPLRRYLSPPALVPCFAFPELINLCENPIMRLLTRLIGEHAQRVVRFQTEEIIEMYWGLSVLLAMVSIRKAWKERGTRVEGRG
ncbi:MAG: hypothetical protein JXB04_04485 [Kiritimatiellae bacterium]|nr:hypothetical protein [Kiritimatiellia bacterium]